MQKHPTFDEFMHFKQVWPKKDEEYTVNLYDSDGKVAYSFKVDGIVPLYYRKNIERLRKLARDCGYEKEILYIAYRWIEPFFEEECNPLLMDCIFFHRYNYALHYTFEPEYGRSFLLLAIFTGQYKVIYEWGGTLSAAIHSQIDYFESRNIYPEVRKSLQKIISIEDFIKPTDIWKDKTDLYRCRQHNEASKHKYEELEALISNHDVRSAILYEVGAIKSYFSQHFWKM